MRSLINILDFSTEEIEELVKTANDIIANPEKYREKCKYKKLATLFYEPSTRTRLSFESAMLELGGSKQFFVGQGRKRSGHRQDHQLLCGHNRHAPSQGRRPVRCLTERHNTCYQCRRRRSQSSHPDSCGSADDLQGKRRFQQSHPRILRRP